MNKLAFLLYCIDFFPSAFYTTCFLFPLLFIPSAFHPSCLLSLLLLKKSGNAHIFMSLSLHVQLFYSGLNVLITDFLFLSQTFLFCHKLSVSVTDFLFLSQTFSFYHRLSVFALKFRTLVLISVIKCFRCVYLNLPKEFHKMYILFYMI